MAPGCMAGPCGLQNEDTATLSDKVDRRTFDSLLAGLQRRPLSPKIRSKRCKSNQVLRPNWLLKNRWCRIQSPLNGAADGKLWVVEMGDYPLGIDAKGTPGGIVRFLEDTNHDGIYDKINGVP